MIRSILTAAMLAAALSACSESMPTEPARVPSVPSLDEGTTPPPDNPTPTPPDTTNRGVIGSGT
jgi:hypothetical protein